MLKKIISLMMAAMLVLSFGSTASADGDINVIINNKPLISDIKPIVVDGRTLVPLRAICEAMNCEVVWIDSSKTANIKNKTHIISMQINNTMITKKKITGDGNSVTTTDVAPMLYNDSTYIPARALAESLDAVVGWDGSTKTVMIMYDTELKYESEKNIEIFAGNGERKNHDSNDLTHASFISPESIDIADDGTIYIGDSGVIRKIKDGTTETVEFEPSYITVDQLRCYKNDVYILTNEFQDESGTKYYGLVKLTDSRAESLFVTEAVYSKITDFTFDKNGKMYVLQNNVGVGMNYIAELNTSSGNFNVLAEADDGCTSIAADGKGNLYIGNSVKGSIYRFNIQSKQLKLFAGVDDNIKFVDGPNPMFFEPRKLKYSNNYLYVLDYNILRRIQINDADIAVYSETLAGKLTVDTNPDTLSGKASNAEIAPSYLMDFAVKNDEIIMTDPKKSVLRTVK